MARGAAFTTSVAFHAAALSAVLLVSLLTPDAPPEAERPSPPLHLWPSTPAVVHADSQVVARTARPVPPVSVTRPPDAPAAPAVVPSVSPQDESPVQSQGPPADDGSAIGRSGDVDGSGDGNRQATSDKSGSGPGPGDEPRRVGGDLQQPVKLFHVKPEYPNLARVAGVSGTVVLECIIDPAGSVVGVRLISGHPLLAPAATSAVRRWRYSPTRLNGQPVSVLLTVTVRFDLAR